MLQPREEPGAHGAPEHALVGRRNNDCEGGGAKGQPERRRTMPGAEQAPEPRPDTDGGTPKEPQGQEPSGGVDTGGDAPRLPPMGVDSEHSVSDKDGLQPQHLMDTAHAATLAGISNQDESSLWKELESLRYATEHDQLLRRLDILKLIEQKPPRDFDFMVHYELGTTYRALARFDDAVSEFTKALRLGSGAYAALGECEELRNNLRRSSEYFLHAADCARREDFPAGELTYLRAAIRVDPSSRVAAERLNIAIAARRRK